VIRITQSQLNSCLQIEGRLDAEGVRALRDVVGTAPTTLTIDLSGLTSIDHHGTAMLAALSDRGCRLQGGSLYVNRLLKEATRDSRN
jgi:anti-anti-sigma regulatory factor